jgi:hypothetical protein
VAVELQPVVQGPELDGSVGYASPRMRARVLIGCALAALAALALAACGSSSGGGAIAGRAPDVIVARATQAIDAVRTVRVSGAISDGSSKHPIRLDLQLVNGRGATGSMSENGASFRLITVGGESYVNGSPEFWRQFGGSAVADQLQGKWLRASASDGDFASLASLTQVHKLLAALLTGHGPLVRGATSTLAGHPVIALHDTSEHGTLYVATTGAPYPIRIQDTGSRGGELNFGDFDAPVTLTPPKSSVDISDLTR